VDEAETPEAAPALAGADAAGAELGDGAVPVRAGDDVVAATVAVAPLECPKIADTMLPKMLICMLLLCEEPPQRAIAAVARNKLGCGWSD
jgi:hypothetical protein